MISDFPESIILDFDGVILDSSEIKTKAFQEFYKGFPDVFDEIMAFHLKNKGISRYEQFRHLCKLLNIDDPAGRVNRYASEFSGIVMKELTAAAFIEGAKDFLEAFYKVVPLHIVSNAPEDELFQIIDEKKIKKYFRSIAGLKEAVGKKRMVLNVLEINGYDRDKTLYIGDTLGDHNVANEIGLPFIGIKNALSNFPPGVDSFDNLKDVKNHLDNCIKRPDR